MQMTGAQIVIEVLCEQGVDTLFGYPGGTILNIYDELYKNSHRLRHIITAHEQGAAHAADGYARATGRTGVVLATSGPGSTNLVTGIATAYMDSVPMVAITANVANDLIGCDSFQEVYIAGITMPITRHNAVVRRVEELADTLREAFRIAITGRPGPVLVDITKDVTAALCEFTPSTSPQVTPPQAAPDAQILAEIATVINEAKRPVVHFGGGVIASCASELVYDLVHKAGIPACHTIMGTGVLSCRDDMNMGLIGMHGNISSGLAVDAADALVVIGARFSDRVATCPTDFAKSAKIVQIDIDASEINKNLHIDYSLVGDVKTVLAALLPLVHPNERREWRAQIDTWREKDFHPSSSDGFLHPHQVIDILSEQVGEDAIIVTDVGQHQMWAAQYCKRTRPRSFLTSGGLGTMGFGYGAAIGAQVGCPDRRVVHITGDGSFHMNCNELCTSVSNNLPIITVIMNNGVLGMVRQWQTLFYDKRYSNTSLHRKTDFVKLAEAFGALGFRASTVDEFTTCMQKALASGRPAVIDCAIDPDEMVFPMIASGATIRDVLTSAQ
ncbi:MAG: biosynthetic-type acetolactate synthase large subunit [Oscillospiraceae bacterium]